MFFRPKSEFELANIAKLINILIMSRYEDVHYSHIYSIKRNTLNMSQVNSTSILRRHKRGMLNFKNIRTSD